MSGTRRLIRSTRIVTCIGWYGTKLIQTAYAKIADVKLITSTTLTTTRGTTRPRICADSAAHAIGRLTDGRRLHEILRRPRRTMTAYSRVLDETFSKIFFAPKAVTGALVNITSLTVPIGAIGSTLIVVFRIGDYARNEPVTIDILFQKRASSTASWVDVATMSMVSPSGVASYGARIGGGQLAGSSDVRAILNSTGDIITIDYCADAWVESRRNPLVSTYEVQHPGGGQLVLDLP